MKTLTCPIA